MNDFKFRAWSQKHKRYMTGDFIQSSYIPVTDTQDGFQLKSAFVLELCTGLKDNTGRYIYQGDIVALKNVLTVCEWSWGGFTLRFVKPVKTKHVRPDGMPGNLETPGSPWRVVGNIHQNKLRIKK